MTLSRKAGSTGPFLAIRTNEGYMTGIVDQSLNPKIYFDEPWKRLLGETMRVSRMILMEAYLQVSAPLAFYVARD